MGTENEGKEHTFPMIQPNDVMSASEENWEEFKKEAARDPLYYNGPGDLLDTEAGRAKFCALNETAVFRKNDPEYPGYKIWVFKIGRAHV